MHSRLNCILPGASLLLVALAASAATSAAWQSHVSKDLAAIYAANASVTGAHAQVQSLASQNRARFDSHKRVQVDVNFDCAAKPPIAALIAAGLAVGTTVKVPPMCVVEGWIAPASLPDLTAVPSVKTIELPHYSVRKNPLSNGALPLLKQQKLQARPQAAAGLSPIDSGGVTLMHADQFVQETLVAGSGVMIGVISDDVSSLSTIEARGELPAVQVILPSANPTQHANLTDEGTMMLEEVYAVAPSATLAFCGPETAPEYIACLQNLLAAGATVVSDDLGYRGFDIFTAPAQNIDSAPIEAILSSNPNVMLFHSVGNDNQDYDQDVYKPIALGTPWTCSSNGTTQTDYFIHGFTASSPYIVWNTPGGSDIFLGSSVATGQTLTNNFDVYIFNNNGLVTCATATGVVGGTSYTVLDGSSLAQGSYGIYIATADTSLSGAFLKVLGFGDGAATFSIVSPGGAYSPQSFATGVLSVGAVDASVGIGDNIELLSTTGPIQLELPIASTLMAPRLVAPDGVYVDLNNTLFKSNWPGELFHGTSAASPNAAAVAALLRSAFPGLTPAQVTNYLESGATLLGSSSPNGTFGYGRVDAIGALNAIPAPSVSGFTTATIVGGTSSAALPINIAGTGALKVSVVPTTLIPADSTGVKLSCSGSQCMVILTPAMGQSGATAVQVTATDGANRTSSYQASVTITKPPAPTVSITSGGSQSVMTGSALAPVVFALAGTGPLTVNLMSNDLSTVSLSQGCGTTSMTCSATLGAASMTPGTATLSVNVQDTYAQSASALATMNETAPPSSGGGGGGALDWVMLLACSGLLVRRQSTKASLR